jgi:hypothetical protein
MDDCDVFTAVAGDCYKKIKGKTYPVVEITLLVSTLFMQVGS